MVMVMDYGVMGLWGCGVMRLWVMGYSYGLWVIVMGYGNRFMIITTYLVFECFQ